MNDTRNQISFFGIGQFGQKIIVTAIVFVILGGGFVSIPKLMKWEISSWKSTVCFNLGAAFLTSIAMEEKECEDRYPDTTKFNEFWYKIQSNYMDKISNMAESYISQDKEEFDEKKIGDYITEQSRLFTTLKLEHEVKIPPFSYLKCGWKSESIVDNQLRYPLISLINSTSLEVDITEHPEDLEVDFRPLHPNFNSVEEKTNDRHTKRWKINAGILPGQGIQIEWKLKRMTL